MKFTFPVGATAALALAGCSQPRYSSADYHPGPAVGHAAGIGVGAVAGNVAGVGAGFGDGFWRGASAPFDRRSQVVRTWRTETTADGRTIQVPVEIPVDNLGRPVGPVPEPASAQGGAAK